jgi:hypothetical protein
MPTEDWDRVTWSKLLEFAGGAVLFFMLVGFSQPGFVFLLDHANLLFHEAGHVFVGFLSSRLEPYGGTIGQLVFPVALAVSFWRKELPISFAGAIIWFFQNWLNIARYMADARAQMLPLVGGGEHDWHKIFGRWHLLAYDTRIARVVNAIGWLGIVAACVWVVWRYWQDRQGAAGNTADRTASNF